MLLVREEVPWRTGVGASLADAGTDVTDKVIRLSLSQHQTCALPLKIYILGSSGFLHSFCLTGHVANG